MSWYRLCSWSSWWSSVSRPSRRRPSDDDNDDCYLRTDDFGVEFVVDSDVEPTE